MRFFSLMPYNCSLPGSFKKSSEACEQASSVSAQSRKSPTYCSTTASERLRFCSFSLVAQSCPILWDPMDCSPPGSSIHGIFQARLLEWIAISFSRGSSQPRDQTQVSHIVGRRFRDQTGFSGGSGVKNLSAGAGDTGLIPDSRRSHMRQSN